MFLERLTFFRQFAQKSRCRQRISFLLFSTAKARGITSERTLRRSLDKYTPDKIRNFAIIAHIDHGKSTLSDRLLQLTNVIPSDANARFLDKLEVERERGITVKAQTCTMFYKGKMLNLIDTPGHVDFNYEVKRSLFACDGAILLVAANQGVQAQTVFNFWDAFQAELTILPVINKIDMAAVDVQRVEAQMQRLFDFNPDEILRISAKTGLNAPSILDAVIERIPPPKNGRIDENCKPCQALIFDSWFDSRSGVIMLVIVKQGTLKRGASIQFFADSTRQTHIISEVGFFHPEMMSCETLNTGQVGFMHCGIKSPKDILVGDTVFEAGIGAGDQVLPFVEIKRMKPTVYSGLFPVEPTEFERLNNAVSNLCLNDSSVVLETDSSAVFGQGWRVGFVGNLHMEVFGQRLEKEYGELAVFTSPSVEYVADIVANESIRSRRYKGMSQIVISKPSSFPAHPTDIERYFEPVVLVTIVTPSEHFDSIDSLCEKARGERVESQHIDETKMLLKWRLPLVDVIVGLIDDLKRVSSGYASFDMKEDGHRECILEKVCIHVNERPVDELSLICPSSLARQRANSIVNRLRDEIPRQQFEVTIKATLGHSLKAITRAVIKPMKRDFSGLLKGNFAADRLGKKLKHQREGKERMKQIGNVHIPREAFLNIKSFGPGTPLGPIPPCLFSRAFFFAASPCTVLASLLASTLLSGLPDLGSSSRHYSRLARLISAHLRRHISSLLAALSHSLLKTMTH